MLVPTAVAIIETPHSYVLERRPDLDGLEYAGKLQLFGGHCLIEGGQEEDPHETIRRELGEELAFQPDRLHLLWQSQAGQRQVSLFYTFIESTQGLTLQEEGEIFELPKTAEALARHRDEMTDFAHYVLTEAIRRQDGAQHNGS